MNDYPITRKAYQQTRKCINGIRYVAMDEMEALERKYNELKQSQREQAKVGESS